jgi:hypothetical protein
MSASSNVAILTGPDLRCSHQEHLNRRPGECSSVGRFFLACCGDPDPSRFFEQPQAQPNGESDEKQKDNRRSLGNALFDRVTEGRQNLPHSESWQLELQREA